VSAAGSRTEAMRSIKNLQAVAMEAEEKMGLHPGTYDFFDAYGQIQILEDLQRAVKMAQDDECIIEIREHRQFTQIKELQSENGVLTARIARLEQKVGNQGAEFDAKIELACSELRKMIVRTDKKITEEVQPVIEGLCKDRTETARQLRAMQEKMSQIDIQELKEMAENAKNLENDVRQCVKRVEYVDTQFQKERVQFAADIAKAIVELKELQRYMQGKLDALMDADADMRRELQLTGERLALTQDDLRLLQEELQRLTNQCSGALEESEDLRDMLGQVREDNRFLKSTQSANVTRLTCLEGKASETWQATAPAVLYFRRFHSQAKGVDVQHSADLMVTTGRGSLSVAGVVVGNDEGLCMVDGPCRRFGTPGYFSSYYELEVDEVCIAPAGAGGMYCGFSIQNGEEVAAHPKHEFDGWLMGGNAKALACRRSHVEGAKGALPGTYMTEMADIDKKGTPMEKRARVREAQQQMVMLTQALPPQKVGHSREFGSFWNSQPLTMGDRIGVLFRCNRDGGAELKISVNGGIRGKHAFVDAPPSEAVSFLFPVVRLAGSTKAVKIMPGLEPPAKILADD